MPSVKNPPLVALMLEEAIPGCIVEGVEYSDNTEAIDTQPDRFVAYMERYTAAANDDKV